MYTTHLSSQERLPRPSTPGTSDVDTPITFADRSDGDDVGNELGKDPIRPTTKPASISHENKDAPAVEVASGGLGRTPSIPVDDQNLVEWCEGDPGHPQNWKRSRKWIAIALVSAYTFMSPVASSILAPSLQQIGEDLSIHDDSERSLCLSIFVLGFAFGPLLFAPISEMYGRNITLQCSNVAFFIFNCACGFAQTKEQLLVFRFFGGIGGSAPLALGSGVLSDLFSADERGLSAGIYALFPILGPAIGPICGGFITDYSTWRWGFWGTTIVDVPILILGLIFLEETYPPVLLRWRKQRLVVETGNHALLTKHEQNSGTFSDQLGQALLRPMKLMGTQIIIVVMGLYQAYLYGLMYIVLTTFPRLWTEDYHQSSSIAGLNYISLGLGYCLGIEISSYLQDRIYRYLKRRNNGVGCPEFRLPLLLPATFLLPVGFLIYGWTAQYHTHWIYPNIGSFIYAAGIMIGFNSLITYVVDSYPTYAASAAAATTLLRSVAAFLFPLFAPTMYSALGNGWGNSLLAFLAIGIGVPAPILLWYYGAALRARSRFCAD
ncbi:hypothetical protein S40285_04418 [Stachybotrys chlorohalonatus IBT 40285]|uniref:Major facilitator superfamily (MFS) profile domain-containing protein n=1 Tax=Stachybotrys chlorohalonatus (strain IBT 40285) TaxID=1283841 RepID=A0A084R1V8_STAC4|nr:hypothetical protein S40285_04418 [Stachybotrys chlorohalonata IBT 40285]